MKRFAEHYGSVYSRAQWVTLLSVHLLAGALMATGAEAQGDALMHGVEAAILYAVSVGGYRRLREVVA